MGYGNIVLTATKGEFIARAIEWFSGSRFSHSLITVPAQVGKEMGLEDASKGVDEVEFDVAYRQNSTQAYLMYQVNLPQDVIDAAIGCCLDSLEQSYGYLAYPWFIWRFLLWKLFKKDIKAQNNWYTGEPVCSGLVRRFLDCPPVLDYFNKNGLKPLFGAYGAGSMTPEDLNDVFVSHPELFKVIENKGF